jgi:hypothetical protein
MKAYLKPNAVYKYCIEMSTHTVIPQEIRTWLTLKDSPFEDSHILYLNKGFKQYVAAFEYYDDAVYFIAWMEHLNADILEL